MGGLRAEELGRLGYRGSVTNPGSHARGRGGLGTMLTAMPFSGDRRTGPQRDSRAIRVRQIAEDHMIGNLVATSACPR
jgi:hypothetical protein